MPELPEVETVRAGLDRYVGGKHIVSARLHRPNLRYPFPPDLVKQVTAQRVDRIRRRAKYLLFDIGDVTLIGHLGMSGRYVVRAQGSEVQSHEHMTWILDDGMEVVYHDPRRFGFVLSTGRNQWQTHPMITTLGVEPFSPECSAQYLAEQLATRRTTIKQLLLDQRVIAGIGNIYASEVLFRTGIHVQTPADACVDKAASLVLTIRQVLQSAIDSGGSTLRNYAKASGDSGYFQHQFQVYGREGKPCYVCKTPIHKITQSGRSSFFCPSCQS